MYEFCTLAAFSAFICGMDFILVKRVERTKVPWTCRTFCVSYILILCKSTELFHTGPGDLVFSSMCQGLVCHLEIKIISLDVHIVMDIHTHRLPCAIK